MRDHSKGEFFGRGISLEQAGTSVQNELFFSLSHWERAGVRV
jgi:hypothetical protein